MIEYWASKLESVLLDMPKRYFRLSYDKYGEKVRERDHRKHAFDCFFDMKDYKMKAKEFMNQYNLQKMEARDLAQCQVFNRQYSIRFLKKYGKK